MIPGEVIFGKNDIVLNEGKKTIKIKVKNVGDRAVQVGSHYHFFEVNRLLEFDRKESFGYRLDIPSGTAVRFEPGEEYEIQLVELGGRKRVIGLNALTEGQALEHNLLAAMERARIKGFIK